MFLFIVFLVLLALGAVVGVGVVVLYYTLKAIVRWLWHTGRRGLERRRLSRVTR